MLRFESVARFAFNHSPEREQRLLSFAKDPANPNDPNEPVEPAAVPEGADEANTLPERQEFKDIPLDERQKFHDAIFDAVLPDDQKVALEQYRQKIEEKIGKVKAEPTENEVAAAIGLTRSTIIDELETQRKERSIFARQAEQLDRSVDVTDEELRKFFTDNQERIAQYITVKPNTDLRIAFSLLHTLLYKEILRMRSEKKRGIKGMKWDFASSSQEFEKSYRTLKNIGADVPVEIPPSFRHENTIYLNPHLRDFTDPVHGETLANQAIIQEATSIALETKTPGFTIDQWVNALRAHTQEWNELMVVMEEVLRNNASYKRMMPERKDKLAVSAALAIYLANNRFPVSDPKNEWQRHGKEVTAIFNRIFGDPQNAIPGKKAADDNNIGFLIILKNKLERSVDVLLETDKRDGMPGSPPSIATMFTEAARENKIKTEVADKKVPEKKEGETDEDAKKKAKEGKDLVDKEIDEEKKKEKATPERMLEGIESARKGMEDVRKKLHELKTKAAASTLEKEEKEKLLHIIDQDLEFFSNQGNDLILMKKLAGAFQRWNLAPGEGGLTTEEKSEIAEGNFAFNPYKSLAGSVEEADTQTEGERQSILDIMQEALAGYNGASDKINKNFTSVEEVENENKKNKSNTASGGVWQWMRKNIFSSQGHVMWLTPLNIINIVKIYKDAIVQNYQSNQKVKENAFAKKINLYKPIDHTLKKLARSSNHTETSEFKEYIEREGYTFDDVFGPDGKGMQSGLLYENRGNFNRAKAVLEYSAEHAWLYLMDPLHGHDVYGIDYEKIEGHQSFEELVQKNESGKKHQEDHGRERVDKYPDVPPIMKTMVHELEHKNIFAVQGIMKRLQEKAKFSHSNTWMLTTLLMLIRDKCEKDPTLKMCLDKGMIDNVSNATIVQSSWSITWLKMMRHDIEKWKLTTEKGVDGFDNNKVTKTMVRIEEKLKEAGANFPNDDEGNMAKYEAIAFVLSGKTFSDKNKEAKKRGLLKYGKWKKDVTISIFESDPVFNEYRELFRDTTATTETEPGNTDPDYFNPENGGSDVLLLDASQTSRILGRKSTSEWNFDSKARGFITQVLTRYDELERDNPSAFVNFKSEMQKKFDYCMDGVWDKSRRPTVVKDTDLKGNNMVDQLASRGLFSQKKIDELGASDLRPQIHRAQRKSYL